MTADHRAELARVARLFPTPGDVVEVRALGTDRLKYGTLSGYFNAEHMDELVKQVAGADGLTGANTCLTINPVTSDLLARSANRLKRHAREATWDADVLCRRWLPIHLDPVRPSGIPSTHDEHAAALQRAEAWVPVRSSPGLSSRTAVAGQCRMDRCKF